MRILLSLFFFLGAGLAVHAQCILGISGVVRDADTRTVIENASVTLLELKKTITTNKEGSYRISGLCPGDYTLRISHTGCETIDLHFHLKEDAVKDFQLPHTENILKEVVVVGSTPTRNEGMTGELKGTALAATRGLSLGEALQKISGVTVLQTGNNIYKPVIQGLHSSRVLILNNGIRQEGQQWGSEHAPEIDPYVANRLTVIKGAASVRYGGDAIGGVILVEPRLLKYQKALSGELNLAAFTNNWQGVFSGLAEGGFDPQGKTAWRVQGTIKRGGNARTPAYWLSNSGVEEMNMSATAGWRNQNRGAELFYSLFHTRLGIFTGSHIGNLTDLENTIRAQQPPDYIRNIGFGYTIERPRQSVQHQLVKFRFYQELGDRSRVSLTLSSQYNVRREFDITRTATELPQLELDLFTSMADAVWEHYGNKKQKGSIGLNAMYQDNAINYRYFIPNYKALDLGLWAAERFQFDKWQFELGLRFDNRRRNQITDNDRPPFNLLTGNVLLPGDPYGQKKFSGFSGTGVLAYRFNDNLRLSVTASSAWRAPQMNELFSNGLHHGAARIEKGDPSLRPERAFNLLGNLIFSNSKWDFEIGVYQKEIKDFIYLVPGYPPQLTIRGAFPSFFYQQTQASLTGSDMNLNYQLSNHLRLMTKASLLRAFDRNQKTWVIQMPSDRYEAALQYDLVEGKKLKQPFLKIEMQHVTRQRRVPPTGNIKITDANGLVSMASDYIAPPPAYTLVNLESAAGLLCGKQKLDLIFSINNLFNVSYRDYMNAFRYFSLDRGRNISVKCKIPF